MTQESLDKSLMDLIDARLLQSSLDPRSNAVVIELAESLDDTERDRVQALVAAQDVAISVQEGKTERFMAGPSTCSLASKICGYPLRGGVYLDPAGCTAGFKAIGKSSGDRFILTAGHCAKNWPNWRTYDPTEGGFEKKIGPTAAVSYPGNDWAAIKVTNPSWDGNPWPSWVAFWGNDNQRAINAESWSYVGQQVCHSGITSGWGCGPVTKKNLTLNYGDGPIYGMTEYGPLCHDEGDSGGPVFIGNTALGLHSGTSNKYVHGCSVTGFYAEITEATEALGVTVGVKAGSPPSVIADNASGIQELQANVNGAVDPNGLQTTYQFQYGTTTSYGSSTLPASAGSGWNYTPVNATIPNLHAGTTYHYRLVAYNASGTSYGDDRQFTTSSAPAAVNTGSAINVYGRAVSGSLFQKACCFGSEGWTNWWHMGSPNSQGITSGPGAVMHYSNLNVYARGADGALYQKACCFGSEGWTNWWHMGSPSGAGIATSPAAVMHGPNLNVYAGGSNDHLYQKWCCSGPEGWSGWWDMGAPSGGGITSSPAVVAAGSGVINVYARGADGALYQKACCFGSEGWTNWWHMGSPSGAGIATSPAAVMHGPNLNVYAGGANGHLYQKWCCSGSEGWSGWWDMGSPPGGGITSGPAAVNAGNGVINVYVRGANGNVYQKACCSGSEGWTGWWDMGSP